ncbi:SH3 domain-containing protein [Aliiroseovarius sp.]|uniref:SH3 domain-containing protein n=1 Tax=Aliiroseovarius sp. TaxID=1872442 RepID=UPI003BAB0FD9
MRPIAHLARRPGPTRLLAAGIALFCLAQGAQATDAVARVDLNVRTGPGTSYGVIDTLRAGELVEVIECQRDRWCYVDHDGPNGWVSSGYLETAPADRGTGRDCRLELRFDGDRPRLSVVCDDPEPPTDPLPAPSTDLACFYDGAGFSGAHFCLGGGRFDRLDNGFNNRISAISIEGEARARVCTEPGQRGLCWVVSGDTPGLGPLVDNKISSLAVYTTWWGGGGDPTPPRPEPEPARPVTYSTGPLSVDGTWMFDLDEGELTTAGADFWYRVVNSTTRRLVPRNGAQIAVGDGSNRGFNGCSRAGFSTRPVDMNRLTVGTYVCVRTSEGRISQFRVNGYSGRTMRIGYTTWES